MENLPPCRTRNDSGWVASLLPPGLSHLANDNREELFKGHAEKEVDAEKEEGGGFIVVNYSPWICQLSSLSISGSLVSVLSLSLVWLVSAGLSVAVCLAFYVSL